MKINPTLEKVLKNYYSNKYPGFWSLYDQLKNEHLPEDEVELIYWEWHHIFYDSEIHTQIIHECLKFKNKI